MTIKHDGPEDFNLKSLVNALGELLSSDPGTHTAGRIWFNTTTSKFMYDNGSAVIDPLARANHSGTQVSSTISDLASVVQAYKLNQFAAPNASVAMGSQQFSGLATATVSGQAIEYAQFQAALTAIQAGLDFKEHVDIVTIANVTIASPGATLNGLTMVAGMRVLATAQTTTSQNGLWTWNGSATPMTRPADSATGANTDIIQGTIVEGYNGTSRVLWMQTAAGTGTNGAITVDTDAQTWVNPYTATTVTGTGAIQVSSSVVSLLLATGSLLTQSGSGLAVDATKVPQKLTGTIPTTTSGIVTISGSTVTINHAFNNDQTALFLRFGSSPGAGNTSGSKVFVDDSPVDANNLTWTFSSAPVANQYKYMVVG